MRRWTWSVAVVVVAFLIAARTALAEAPHAGVSATPLESASSSSLFNHLTSTLAAAHSSMNQPIQTVAIPPRTSINFPKKSGFRPKPPNIHTRPVKKNKTWWPFGHK